jgi:tetratricopeptide (TPR) repeat protein
LKVLKNKYISVAAIGVAALLLIFPLRAVVGSYYYQRTFSLLLDSSNGREVVPPVTRETLPKYAAAIQSLETARSLVPSNAIYHKAVSELYAKLAIWAMVLEGLNVELPPAAPTSKQSFEKAEAAVKTAIRLEPTNPDHHIALAGLYDLMDKLSGLSEKELARAIQAYPVNAALRHAVALQHLNAGRPGDALEHARTLAKIEGAAVPGPNKTWLFNAFEIAWRATKDVQVVQGMAPDDPESLRVLREYLKWKGIKER